MASYDTDVTAAMTGPNKAPVPTDLSDQFSLDPVIRSRAEAGYLQTAPRFTSVPRRKTIRYEGLTVHDRDLILAFEKANVGVEFTYTPPDEAAALTVVFSGPVRYVPWEQTNYLYWAVEFDVETPGGV